MRHLISHAISCGVDEIFSSKMALMDVGERLGFQIARPGPEGVLRISLDPLRR